MFESGYFIKKIVANATNIQSPDLEAHYSDFRQALERSYHLRGIIDNLLGVEEEAKKKLISELDINNYHQNSLWEPEFSPQIEKKSLSERYKHLDLAPLKWRDDKGFPVLAIFSLDSPTFRLQVNENGQKLFIPKPPYWIEDCYDDVFHLLKRIMDEKRKKTKKRATGLMLSCRFNGLIPLEEKEKINSAKKYFGVNIYIIAEPGTITLNEITYSQIDPLIVGYNEEADAKGLWLISSFNTTPVEEAMILNKDKIPN
jgi:hypothetical protein